MIQDPNEKVEEYSGKTFDHWLFYVSCGAFGLSLIAIEKLIGSQNVSMFCLQVISWICFALCIILSLCIQLVNSIVACKAQQNQDYDKQWAEMSVEEKAGHNNDAGKYKNKKLFPSIKFARCGQWASVVLLFSGMLFMIFFIYSNVK